MKLILLKCVTDMVKETIELESEEDTRSLARSLTSLLAPGHVLLLSGDLGAGKTTLTRYLCQELGIDQGQVASPTFTVIHEYHGGRIPVAHVDLYRLGPGADVMDLGLYEYLERGFLVIMEWAEFMTEALEYPTVKVHLKLLPDGTRLAQLEISSS